MRKIQNIWLLGATSTIASAAARQYAEQGAKLVLVSRSAEKNAALKADLEARVANEVYCFETDLVQCENKHEFFQNILNQGGSFDVLLLAYGGLTVQDEVNVAPEMTEKVLHENFSSAAAWLQLAANEVESKGAGCLAVISSVAGDRGRRSNYMYGAAKAGLTTLTEGLQHRLSQSGGRALVIKPGFVDTAMTTHLPKNALWASADKVAADIIRAIEKGKTTLYTPRFWQLIMLLIRHMPEFIFRKVDI